MIHERKKLCDEGLYLLLDINFRGAEKIQFLQSLGADHVIDPTQNGILDSVKKFLKSRKLQGIDVLYDPVGGKFTKEAMKLLKWGAQILVIGFASGQVPIIPANIALVKVRLRLHENCRPTN